jgi:multiple sugar transport system permease protein/raffinose/stachyose/melibiose transport system permease protein
MFLPLFLTIYYSLTNYDFYKTLDFIGVYNYVRLLQDPVFLKSLRNTFIYALATIVPQISLGLGVSVFLNGAVIGQRFHRIAFFIPHVTSMVVVSMIWIWIYDPATGVMNQFMKLIGIGAQKWLSDPRLALFSIILMSIWKLIGYNMIIYLAALQQIPKVLYEVATIDGASDLQKFFKVTLPLLSPTTFFLFVIACILSFNVFEQVNIMTGGGPLYTTTTVVHQIYERAFTNFQMGYACSMACVLLLVTMTLTFVNFRLGSRRVDVGVY